jgi:iron complex transport system substrate-binding protein
MIKRGLRFPRRSRSWLQVWRVATLAVLLLYVIGPLSGAEAQAAQSNSGNPGLVMVGEAVRPSLPVTVRSADGRDVTVMDTSRIVSLSGSISELVFSLRMGSQMVGRDVSATFPEARHLPLVTRAHDVSAEAVLSLHPTLVLASVNNGPPTALDQIRSIGVPVITFAEPTSVDDIAPRIRAVAATLGVPSAGEELVTRTETALVQVRGAIPSGQSPRVAFLYMRGQAAVYMIGGPMSGADSMIRAAGGVDAGTAMRLDRPFTPITSEALVLAAPDVILMTTTGLESVGSIDGLLNIPGIAQTPAGRNRRVITVEDGLLFGFGPRTPAALDLIVSQLYAGSGRLSL